MLNIVYEENPKAEDVQVLNNGIIAFAKQQKNHKPFQAFGFFIRDNSETIQGGCNGVILYGSLHVDSLWVHESLRGKGYGKKVMAAVEKLAVENHCPFITVFTMDWEALDFYKKLGFYVEFERHGYEKNSIFYFLRKDLE
ncbi:MAG: GNAT family N-acetyltransferase [Gammaproteobacteria bacterium]|nr:GNAT family N-acetyltransferase [Gammaproteobacteria bacterium]